jgi:hypothetical protein
MLSMMDSFLNGCPTWSLDPDGEGRLLLSLAGDWRLAEAARLRADSVLAAVGEGSARHSCGSMGTALGQWDSLLMTFCSISAGLAPRRELAVDVTGLPDGVQALLSLAAAAGAQGGSAYRPADALDR